MVGVLEEIVAGLALDVAQSICTGQAILESVAARDLSLWIIAALEQARMRHMRGWLGTRHRRPVAWIVQSPHGSHRIATTHLGDLTSTGAIALALLLRDFLKERRAVTVRTSDQTEELGP
jgi:hypothetical protein